MNIICLRRIVALFSIAVFALITAAVVTDHAHVFDDPVRNALYSLRCEWLTDVVIVLTNTASAYLIVALCIILLLVPKTRILFGIPLSAGALGTMLINRLIKSIVDRPRPEVLHLVTESNYSFPSGHSITSMFFYGLAICLLLRYLPHTKARTALIIVLAIPMLIVGPTRVYLGVHYPTDVLAGWCLGFSSIVLVIEILDAIEKRKSN